jgi:hypothetical protein
MSHQIVRIFDSSCSPQWAAIQRGAQCSCSKRLALVSHLDASLDESSIHLRFDEPLAKRDQCSFTERCLIGVQAIQNQLPPTIHERCFDHLIIRSSRVRL